MSVSQSYLGTPTYPPLYVDSFLDPGIIASAVSVEPLRDEGDYRIVIQITNNSQQPWVTSIQATAVLRPYEPLLPSVESERRWSLLPSPDDFDSGCHTLSLGSGETFTTTVESKSLKVSADSLYNMVAVAWKPSGGRGRNVAFLGLLVEGQAEAP